MVEVRFSPAAESDLEMIAAFIARDDPQRGLAFVRELQERTAILSEHPEAGPARDVVRPGLRALTYGRYVIFYSINRSAVRIERVLHGARDVSQHLKP